MKPIGCATWLIIMYSENIAQENVVYMKLDLNCTKEQLR